MSKLRLRHAFVAVTLPLIACSASDRPGSRETEAPPSAGSPIQITVAHRDERLGVPSFAWVRTPNGNGSASHANAAQAAVSTMRRLGSAFALNSEALASLGEPQVDDHGSGPIVAKFQQRVGKLEVFRGGLSVALRRDLSPIAASGLVAPALTGNERAFAIGSSTALATALRWFPAGTAPAFAASTEADGEVERFAAPGLREPARVKRVLFPQRGVSGVELEPAYYAEVLVTRGPAHSFVVSAIDGRLLFENNLVKNDANTYRVFADPQTLAPMDGPQGNGIAPHPTGKPDRMKLTWQPSQLVTLSNVPFSKNDPWLPPGATKTEGNNVHAYADLADPDGFGAGDIADEPSAASTFDRTYDTNASPGATTASIQASTTHLFYVTNFLHDWFYDAGFDEASGNHQKNNLGRGGKARDALLTEAQDSSGRNNADATVPSDGSSPRIQMYIFAGTAEAELTVNSPASIVGKKGTGTSGGFGKDLFDTTGVVVLGVDDGGADPNDGCEALGVVTGKIVLLHRGTCSFAQKAKNAEAAGALGAIIANVATSTSPAVAPFMGGTQPNIHIPVLSLGLADGRALEAAIPQAPSVTMKRVGGVDVDGALDTSIVSHEWGHVLSGRLVGNGNGLRTNQAGGLGEGWGDFTSLLLMARADDPDAFGGAYTNGAYAMSGAGDDIYFGTRRVPYSVDFAKNALTFKHIQNGVPLPSGLAISFGEDGSSNSEVHNTGEVWASMLWECYVSLLRDPRLTFTEAQTRMKRYLVASLKLTPVDPTFVEARDAVLAAAYAGDDKDAALFWQAFARRGIGAGAEGPGKESISNAGVKESFDAGSSAIVTSAILRDDAITCDRDGILDEGEVGTIELTVQNAGSMDLTALTAKLSSKTPGVTILDDAPTTGPVLKTFASSTFKIKAAMRATAPLDLVNLDVTLSDPSFTADQIVNVTIPARYHADESPETATKDSIETTRSSWTVAGGTPALKWARDDDGANHVWRVGNGIDDADNRLQSPPFTIEGTSLTVSYRHRWYFRSSTRRAADFDGGVLEVSVDASPWKDASTFGKVDYNTTLDLQSRGENPLKGRPAYGNKSANYPEWVKSSVVLNFASQPQSVRIRFRAGNGQGFTTAAQGWDVDDVELVGATSKPFYSFVAHRDACDPSAPTANAGPTRSAKARETLKLEGSGSTPYDLPLTFAWRQINGAPVVLRDANTATPSFEAPDRDGTVRFELRAHDGKLLSPASAVDVNVGAADAPPPAGDEGCSCRSAPGSSSGETRSLAVSVSLAALGVAGALERRRRASVTRRRL